MRSMDAYQKAHRTCPHRIDIYLYEVYTLTIINAIPLLDRKKAYHNARK